jgi:hypothetical protein
MPALELACQGDGAGTDCEAVPARLEPDVDVKATITAGLGVAGSARGRRPL